MTHVDLNRLLTLSQMARVLGVSSSWLRTECERGALPHIKAGSTLLFNSEVVQRLLEARAAQEGVSRD